MMEVPLRKPVVRVWLVLFAALSSCAAMSWATVAQAATITVQNTADNGPGSLRRAVADAAPGDTIDFDSDVRGVITLETGVIEISKSLKITGPGAAVLVIDGDENDSVFENFANGVTISGLSIVNGFHEFAGGGVYNDGRLTLREVIVAGNEAGEPGGSSFGGGIANDFDGVMTILNSTIVNNGAVDGGAIANDGSLSIVNTTITQNFAEHFGAGIFNEEDGVLRLSSATVARNEAVSFFEFTFGGGILNLGSAQLANSIISDNFADGGPDLDGKYISQDFNLVSSVDEDFVEFTGTTTHDILGFSARLDRLGNYGGPTPTHALRVGSPALDAGKSFGVTTDQRGEKRPFNRTDIPNAEGSDGSDIGAFEDRGPVDVPQDSNTLVVNTARDTDDGACTTRDCSLYEAIIAANAKTGADTIAFNINDLNGPIISLNGVLPDITDPVTIDGSTQPGFNGQPIVQITRSTEAGAVLNIPSNGSKIKALIIARNRGIAISISGNGNRVEGCALVGNSIGVRISGGSGNVIGGVIPPPPGSALSPATNMISSNSIGVLLDENAQGNALMTNAIGTTIDGQEPQPNAIAGVIVDGASGNLIGVPTGVPGFGGNLISGNDGPGVWLRNGANSNSVQNNLIGSNFVPQIGTATKALPNTGAGVLIEDSSNNSVGGQPSNGSFSSQVVCGNNGDGILIRANEGKSATGNSVSNNEVGLVDVTNGQGTIVSLTSIPNTGAGIHLINAASNIIGTTSTANSVPTNRIGFNGGSGILIEGARANGNILDHNFVGLLDQSGFLAAAPNGKDGIEVIGAPGNLIGGPALARFHNTISSNKGNGISISGATARGNRIFGNSIGTNELATLPMPNGGSGIRLDGVANTRIGGIGIEPNFIGYNKKSGIEIVGNAAVGNSIRNNRIFENRVQGIDLGADGLTANDNRDGDSGPNRRQNYPVLTSVLSGNNRSMVIGTLNSTPNQIYAIDFFSATTGRSVQAPNASRYIGSLTVRTNAQGIVNFTQMVGERLGSRFITATATQVSTGDTSEFAPSKRPLVDQTAPNISSVNVQSLFGIGGVTVTVTARDAQGIDNVRLRFKRRTTKGGAVANTFETSTAFVRTLPNGASIYELKTKGLASGFYTVEAIVEDGLGNTTTSPAREFFVLFGSNFGNFGSFFN